MRLGSLLTVLYISLKSNRSSVLNNYKKMSCSLGIENGRIEGMNVALIGMYKLEKEFYRPT